MQRNLHKLLRETQQRLEEIVNPKQPRTFIKDYVTGEIPKGYREGIDTLISINVIFKDSEGNIVSKSIP